MSRRLNDTESLTSRPFQAGEDHSISVRRVENGYLTRTSSYNPGTGDCKSAEVFTKNPPRLIPPKMDSRQGSVGEGNTLKQTKEYLGGDY